MYVYTVESSSLHDAGVIIIHRSIENHSHTCSKLEVFMEKPHARVNMPLVLCDQILGPISSVPTPLCGWLCLQQQSLLYWMTFAPDGCVTSEFSSDAVHPS